MFRHSHMFPSIRRLCTTSSKRSLTRSFTILRTSTRCTTSRKLAYRIVRQLMDGNCLITAYTEQPPASAVQYAQLAIHTTQQSTAERTHRMHYRDWHTALAKVRPFPLGTLKHIADYSSVNVHMVLIVHSCTSWMLTRVCQSVNHTRPEHAAPNSRRTEWYASADTQSRRTPLPLRQQLSTN